ncbi:Beta-galactosidase [Aspergillus mulundensis]|uniref:Beta-galactosidase n=1 Tax=Aspergillus mulundensis TaxID=1810919 RepID=A0A3D8RSJ9_9EURO|nr:Beta-galactosidase [Aspergillus mulundensis]RDW76791.1 Beta-galactosidase [Aspergillus mulundensis]
MKLLSCIHLGWTLGLLGLPAQASPVQNTTAIASGNVRERTSLNKDWKFWHSKEIPDNVVYDLRPDANDSSLVVLKPWVLPSGNDYIADASAQYERPLTEPDIDLPYVENEFDDTDWEQVHLPHDWAIKGPFYTDEDPEIGSAMGRLPVQGVGWYRRKLDVSRKDKDDLVLLEIDGAMSYPIVWVNGHLVGGWPYGYNSFQLDITPYLKPGKGNQLAIRVENPAGDSSRWYPGAGIYRNVWLTKVNPIHVAHYGTKVTTKDISTRKATVDLEVQIENKADKTQKVEVVTEVFVHGSKHGRKVAQFPRQDISLQPESKGSVSVSTTIRDPRLWGPPPTQSPDLYVAVTSLYDARGRLLDIYKTKFGIRSVEYTPDNGLLVNGERVPIQGVNQHHDLGALGAAWNKRAARRQLEILQELGVNAIRTAHNPPTPELLELTDEMGFLVLDEIFDSWAQQKTESDFHLIFNDWSEPDLRSWLRRDRNHPSVIIWSYGNEIAEQNRDAVAAEIATYLQGIVKEEDTTRPTTASMNSAWPNSSFAGVVDLISLNYQGEGLRYGPAYAHLTGNRRDPQYDAFHAAHPEKLILGSEVAWSLSSRGSFSFPVTSYQSAPVNDTSGGNSTTLEISAYELYSADAGSAPDRVFSTQDQHPFVAGGFVWAGWDYIGEPYPYYDGARSAYSGIIDLAGFKKERFYQYQARWRPDFPMAHIVPHWTWPDRVGEVTPVHVFTSGDEAELFLNGVSQGRRKKEPLTYRIRWDDVVYEPGEVYVVAYKDGTEWATHTVRTAGAPAALRLSADREAIAADGEDLLFVTVEVVDAEGIVVPQADNLIHFEVSGPAEIVATDNGFQADFTAFPSHDRKAFNGLALAIVKGVDGRKGDIVVTASSQGVEKGEVVMKTV